MSRASRRMALVGWVAPFLVGCLAPVTPCPCREAPSPADSQGGSAVAQTNNYPKSAEMRLGVARRVSTTNNSPSRNGVQTPLVVWTGEETDGRAQGWASCGDPAADCRVTLEAKQGVGRDGSVGLEFKAKGPEWMGFGWNWFGWWPSDAGTDVSAYRTIRLWIRVLGEPGMAPEPFTVRLALGGSARAGKDASELVAFVDYAPSFADGNWHHVELPIEPMLRGKGETFEPRKTWSITIGAWNQGVREYSMWIDDIEFLR